MKKLFKELFEPTASLIVDHFPFLTKINTIVSLIKHLIGLIRFIKDKNLLQPFSRIFSKFIKALSYEFNKFLKEQIEVIISFINRHTITGLIMIIGLSVLMPLGFISAFFTGLLHYTENQNIISAASIAMLYFGSISMFSFLQYRILKSTETA